MIDTHDKTVIAFEKLSAKLRDELNDKTREQSFTIRPIKRPDGSLAKAPSERELQILRMMARGMSNPQISAAMHLSEKTVKNHISRVLEKMSVSNRSSAIVVGIQAGLIDLDLVEVIEYERFQS